MPRYRLKDKCLFVDADVYDEAAKKPKKDKKPGDIPHAHILDKRDETKPVPFLALNDEAGFIARFIVMGVETDLIPDILKSEYPPGAVADPVKDVKDVLAMINPYLELRSPTEPYTGPQKLAEGKHQTGKYALDFGVNWFGTGWIKGPL
jgi:hypothetical protein